MSCKEKWIAQRLSDIIEFNPKETLRKGQYAKKIAMEQLRPFCKTPIGYNEELYNGGAKFKNGDTLLARITPCLENGKTAQVNFLNSGEVGFGSTEYIVLRAKEGKADKDFVYYLSVSPYFRNIAIKSMVGSSGRQRVQQSVLEDAVFLLTDLPTQKRISSILSSLDDKIELNEKINQNLEAQAQAIFKSWFVDFEPFKNGKFVDSELGKIPEGWRVKKLGEICKCVLGGTPSRSHDEYWNGNIPWINSGKTNEFRIISPSEFITDLGLKRSATKLLPKKTTVLAITGATLGQVSLLEIDACANQSVVGILENNFIPYEYIYRYISYNIGKIISSQTGGAQQHINKENVEFLDVILPPQHELNRYKSIVKYLYGKIATLEFQSHILSQLRDTLLPKLMSGEIDVSEVAV